MHTHEISRERACELLCYDANTGALTWRVNRGNGVKAGAVAGSLCRGYRRICMAGYRHVFAHRLAWLIATGEWPIGEIDHINGITDDNRMANLRVVTRAGNCQNKRRAQSNNRSGLLGVKVRDRGFEARIKRGGVSTYLGIFDTAEDAHNAYVKAKRMLHAACAI